MKGIRELIRESVREYLDENIGLAKKKLKEMGISEDNPYYIKAKEFLIKNNSIGYLGFAVNMSSNDISKLPYVVEFMVNNKDFLKVLPKDISTYDNFDNLVKDVENIEILKKIKKLTNKLTNKNLINLLTQYDLNSNEIKDIEYFINIESSDQKEFLTKTDKYKDVETFLNDLSEFVKDHKIGFKYNIVLNKINSMNENHIKVLFNNNNMIVCKIYSYEASREIGSTSWCIVGSEEQFNNYTDYGKNFQYFFFNFNTETPSNLKMIAFTMDENNNITASYDRYDKHFNDPLKYLNKLNIKNKIFFLNSREFIKNKLNNLKNDRFGDYIRLEYVKRGNNKDVYYLEDFRKEHLYRIAIKFLGLLNDNKKNNLDLFVNELENYPTYIKKYEDVIKYEKYKDFNIFSFLIENWDDMYDYYKKNSFYDEDDEYNDIKTGDRGKIKIINKDDLIEILKKIYLSKIKIKEETKRSILFFLKENGIDILKLSQLKNKELSGSEFGMLSKRGENLKPIIQNKLSAIRRGEDVSMNEMEISYAIDNGFKNIIIKYYEDMLPYFKENQLSFEDLKIYKKLNMLKEISKIINGKANMYGLSTLNSIERSLYDTSKNK